MSTKNFIKDIDLTKVDDLPIDDDARDVAEELKDVTAKCYEIGCALRINQSEMNKLEGLCRHEPVKALNEVIEHYLKENYNTNKHGHPSWRKIVAAVSNSMGGCNHALAKKIAQNHQVGSRGRPSQETASSFVDVTERQFQIQQPLTDPQTSGSTPSQPTAGSYLPGSTPSQPPTGSHVLTQSEPTPSQPHVSHEHHNRSQTGPQGYPQQQPGPHTHQQQTSQSHQPLHVSHSEGQLYTQNQSVQGDQRVMSSLPVGRTQQPPPRLPQSKSYPSDQQYQSFSGREQGYQRPMEPLHEHPGDYPQDEPQGGLAASYPGASLTGQQYQNPGSTSGVLAYQEHSVHGSLGFAGQRSDQYTQGQPTSSQYTQGQPTSGQYTQGQPTSGQYTQGQPTSGQYTQGQPTSGQYTQGQPTSGQYTQGQPTSGQYTQGQPTSGQYTQGQPTSGQYTKGQPTSGQYTQGQPTQGRQVPSQNMQGQRFSGQFTLGQLAQGQYTQGQLTPGHTQGQLTPGHTQGQPTPGHTQGQPTPGHTQGQPTPSLYIQGQQVPSQNTQGQQSSSQFRQIQQGPGQYIQGQQAPSQSMHGQSAPRQFIQGQVPLGQAQQPTGYYQQGQQTPSSQQGQPPSDQHSQTQQHSNRYQQGPPPSHQYTQSQQPGYHSGVGHEDAKKVTERHTEGSQQTQFAADPRYQQEPQQGLAQLGPCPEQTKPNTQMITGMSFSTCTTQQQYQAQGNFPQGAPVITATQQAEGHAPSQAGGFPHGVPLSTPEQTESLTGGQSEPRVVVGPRGRMALRPAVENTDSPPITPQESPVPPSKHDQHSSRRVFNRADQQGHSPDPNRRTPPPRGQVRTVSPGPSSSTPKQQGPPPPQSVYPGASGLHTASPTSNRRPLPQTSQGGPLTQTGGPMKSKSTPSTAKETGHSQTPEQVGALNTYRSHDPSQQLSRPNDSSGSLNMSGASETSLETLSLQSDPSTYIETLSTMEDTSVPGDVNFSKNIPQKFFSKDPKIVEKWTENRADDNPIKKYKDVFSATKYYQEGYVESSVAGGESSLQASQQPDSYYAGVGGYLDDAQLYPRGPHPPDTASGGGHAQQLARSSNVAPTGSAAVPATTVSSQDRIADQSYLAPSHPGSQPSTMSSSMGYATTSSLPSMANPIRKHFKGAEQAVSGYPQPHYTGGAEQAVSGYPQPHYTGGAEQAVSGYPQPHYTGGPSDGALLQPHLGTTVGGPSDDAQLHPRAPQPPSPASGHSEGVQQPASSSDTAAIGNAPSPHNVPPAAVSSETASLPRSNLTPSYPGSESSTSTYHSDQSRMNTMSSGASSASTLSSFSSNYTSMTPRPVSSFPGAESQSTTPSGLSSVSQGHGPRTRGLPPNVLPTSSLPGHEKFGDDDATPTEDPPQQAFAGAQTAFTAAASLAQSSIISQQSGNRFKPVQPSTESAGLPQPVQSERPAYSANYNKPESTITPNPHLSTSSELTHSSERESLSQPPLLTVRPSGPESRFSDQSQDIGRSNETMREVEEPEGGVEGGVPMGGAEGPPAVKPGLEKKPPLKEQSALLNSVNNTAVQCSSVRSSVSGSVPITQQFENMSVQNPSDVGGATMCSECTSVPAQNTGPIEPPSHQSQHLTSLNTSGDVLHNASMASVGQVGGAHVHVPCSSTPSDQAGPSLHQSGLSVSGDVLQNASMASVSQVGGVHYHEKCMSAPLSTASGEFLSEPPNVRPGDRSMSGLSSVGGTGAHEQERSAEPQGELLLNYSSLRQSEVLRTSADGDIVPDNTFQAFNLTEDDKHRKIRLSFATIQPEWGRTQLSEHLDLYPMGRPHHGLAVIIDNEKFKNPKHLSREGTRVDERNLTITFCYLGYNVEVYRDLGTEQMCDLFEGIKRRDHSHYDSFVCCILTHGESGKIIGSDSTPIVIDTLTDQLCAANCSQLKQKPKIFFIQACRGKLKCRKVATDNAHNSGSEEHSEEEDVMRVDPQEVTDGPHYPQDPEGSILTRTIARSFSRENSRIESDSEIPDDADFFFGYATPSGRVAWRDLDYGSWYISELCKALCLYGHTLSLSDIIVKVHKEVGEKYQHQNYKQAPETTTRLTRKVFF